LLPEPDADPLNKLSARNCDKDEDIDELPDEAP
jgi:hypothetical protein